MTTAGTEERSIRELKDWILDHVSIERVVRDHIEGWDRTKSLPSQGDYWACCPLHQEATPSFHVRERVSGKKGGRFKCFGCGESGNVIDFLMAKTGMSYVDVVVRLAGADYPKSEQRYADRPHVEEVTDEDKRAAALMIWEQGTPLIGSPAEAYLRVRGIGMDLTAAQDLRFHARAPYWGYQPEKSKRYPAMVAAIRKPDGAFIGCHVTYILPDGSGKAELETTRKVFGAKAGGFILLGPMAERMVIAEGIESAFSASEVSGRSPLATVTSENMAKLPLLPNVRDYLIAYDRDPKDQGVTKARELAKRLLGAGVVIRGFPPPMGCSDWNDASKARRS